MGLACGWCDRTNFVSGAFLTHTHKRRGGREGGKERGQPARTNNGKTRENKKQKTGRGTHNKQAKQRKGAGEGRERKHKGSTQEPNPGTQKSNQRKAKQQNRKQKLKQDSTGQEQRHTWGCGKGRAGLGREKKEERRTGRRKKGGVPSYACWIHEPTSKEGRKVHPAILQSSALKVLQFCNILYILQAMRPSAVLWVISVMWRFSGTRHLYATIWSRFPRALIKIIKSRQNSEVLQQCPILRQKAGSNSMCATERPNGTRKSVRPCPFTLLIK